VSADTIAAAGAFLSGAGSVMGAWFVIRSMRKQMEHDCDERLRQFREGIDQAERIEHPERYTS
jgi:hypothetical protein